MDRQNTLDTWFLCNISVSGMWKSFQTLWPRYFGFAGDYESIYLLLVKFKASTCAVRSHCACFLKQQSLFDKMQLKWLNPCQAYLLVRQLLLMPVVLYTGYLLKQNRRVHLQTLVQFTVSHPLPVRDEQDSFISHKAEKNVPNHKHCSVAPSRSHFVHMVAEGSFK